LYIRPVPPDISIDSSFPELSVARRPVAALSASGMAVPKAAVDEYDLLVAGQYDVRVTGQISQVKSKPIAHAM
jgi:hypothetical protein